ncbi:uncharacterized protein DSM5745_05064 [Aspergillus mulundensis]|uniref:Uncharacterized protein n=1 Tax=Aspergillus mulundensis TaxID=1810919 RepID=A0A3D8S5C1_9EURO|nr:hypothetical protein DSM5745_05064 [Aspergillus mulundensis]RDW81507.1 hypothetical protein DSM5745_05064 [Aspergillus mulundensis]
MPYSDLPPEIIRHIASFFNLDFYPNPYWRKNDGRHFIAWLQTSKSHATILTPILYDHALRLTPELQKRDLTTKSRLWWGNADRRLRIIWENAPAWMSASLTEYFLARVDRLFADYRVIKWDNYLNYRANLPDVPPRATILAMLVKVKAHYMLTTLLAQDSVRKKYIQPANPDLRTTLSIATNNDDLDTTRVLLGSGADLGRSETVLEYSLLRQALTMGVSWQLFDALLAAGATVEIRDSDHGYSLLHHALTMGVPLELFHALLAAGAPVNIRDRDQGYSLLHHAAAKGCSIQIVEALIAAGLDVNDRVGVLGHSPLHYAAAQSISMEVVEALITAGANVWAKGDLPNDIYPIHSALMVTGQPAAGSIAETLLKVMLETEHQTSAVDWKLDLLRYALDKARNHDCELAGVSRILVEDGVDIFAKDTKGMSAMDLVDLHLTTRSDESSERAAFRGQELAAALLQADPHLWPQGHINRRLWEASRKGPVLPSHISLFANLIRYGESAMEFVDWDRSTALHYLCDLSPMAPDKDEDLQNVLQMITLLLDCGANVYAENSEYLTPLHLADMCKWPRLIRVLLRNGPDEPLPAIPPPAKGPSVDTDSRGGKRRLVNFLLAQGRRLGWQRDVRGRLQSGEGVWGPVEDEDEG